jgi:hypothetical protein
VGREGQWRKCFGGSFGHHAKGGKIIGGVGVSGDVVPI